MQQLTDSGSDQNGTQERTRAAVDKAYADRPDEGDAEARAAA
ncbi:hypothetical protein [Streptomyces sp. IBSBF 2435]